MTPLDAMYAASMVTFAPRMSKARNPYATMILRRGAGVAKEIS